jgi:hypothetical protein
MNQYHFSSSYAKTLQMLSHSYSRTFTKYGVEDIVRYEISAGKLLLQFNQRLRLLIPRKTKLIQRRLCPICPHFDWLDKDQNLSHLQATKSAPY